MFCPNCGTNNKETSKFCKKCGKPLTPMVSQHTPRYYETQGDTPVVSPQKSGNNGLLIICVVLAILILLVGGFVAKSYFFSADKDSSETIVEESQSADDSKEESQDEVGNTEESGGDDIIQGGHAKTIYNNGNDADQGYTDQEEVYEEDYYEEDEPDYDYASEWVIYDSDSRYITETELNYLSDWEICIARNELYARHGYRFVKNKDVKQHFNNCSWYSDLGYTQSQAEAKMNKYEKKNKDIIRKYEKKYGINQ